MRSLTPHDADSSRSQAGRVWRPPQRGIHLAEWTSEMVGTAILLFGGLSAVVLDFGRGSAVAAHVPSVSLRLLITGAIFAATGGLVTVSPLGRRSGAHLNPAVTFAFWATGHVRPLDLAGYAVAQCAGAIGGAALVRLVWGRSAASVRDGMTLPGPRVGSAAVIGIEALMTATLLLTILLFVSRSRTARWTPLAVWFVITVLVWRGARYTGTSLNPARSLGPAVIAGDLRMYGLYVVGPLAGALAAVVLLGVLPLELEPLTAKLFHHPADPTIFKSALPVADRPPRNTPPDANA